ncbi:LysR family transcriptional regulator [Streptococcus hyointestinalis]|uniref:LysR family transcriptional regulator n=1 Tax=Streptococcus hyointestinalis TaxID=1337 RepID=UPI0013DF2840
MFTHLSNYFLATAREGNITRGAQQLFVSHPTLSKQMPDLAKTLNKLLCIRVKRQNTLAEDGEFFNSKATEILQLVELTESASSKIE